MASIELSKDPNILKIVDHKKWEQYVCMRRDNAETEEERQTIINSIAQNKKSISQTKRFLEALRHALNQAQELKKANGQNVLIKFGEGGVSVQANPEGKAGTTTLCFGPPKLEPSKQKQIIPSTED